MKVIFLPILIFLSQSVLAIDVDVKVLEESLKSEKIVIEFKVPKHNVVTKIEAKVTNLEESGSVSKFSTEKIKQKSLREFYIEIDRNQFDPSQYILDLTITTKPIRFAKWTSSLTRAQYSSAHVKFTVPPLEEN